MRFLVTALVLVAIITNFVGICEARVFDGSSTNTAIRHTSRKPAKSHHHPSDFPSLAWAGRKQVDVPVVFALPRHNASFTVLASCPVDDGSSVIVEWAVAGPFQGLSLLRVAHISAHGTARTVSSNVTLGDTPPTARCGPDGTVVAWTDQNAVGISGLSGALLFSVASPSAVAVTAASVYLAVPSGFMGPGVLYGYSLPSGASLFAANVSCTYALVARPVASRGSVHQGSPGAAVWVGCLVNNGTVVDGATGAKIADTGSLLSSALAYAPSPSALVAIAFDGDGNPIGFGVSWTTGRILWRSADMASGNGNLFADSRPAGAADIAVAVVQNTAPQPCQFVSVNASTGATIMLTNFTCHGQNGLDLGVVAGATALVTVALMNAASTSFIVFDSAAAGPALLNVDAPATQCPPAPANCPPLGQRVAQCSPDEFAVGRGFPSTTDGLVRPARIAFYASGTGAHLADTAHVLAHAPSELRCGSGGSLVVTSPDAVVVLAPNSTSAPTTTAPPPMTAAKAGVVTPLTLLQMGAMTRPVNDARSRFVGAALWSPPTLSNHTTTPMVLTTLALNGSSSVLSAYPVSLGSPIADSDIPFWQTPTCVAGGSQYTASLAVDDASGVAWALCTENTTAVNLTTGAVIAVTPGPQEQYAATPAFPGRGVTLFTSRHWEVAQLSIRRPHDAAADSGFAVTKVELAPAKLRPVGLQAFPASEVAVAYLQPADVGGLWSVASSLVGVNLTSGTALWSWPSSTVVDMPCRSHEGGVNMAQRVAVVIGAISNMDPAPAVLGVDPVTGAVSWSVSLANFIDPEAATSEGRPQHHSTCTSDGTVVVTVAGAVLQIRTVDGSVDFVRLDDRFFAPVTGTTFGSSTATRVAPRGSHAVVVPISRDETWLLSGRSGRTVARLSDGVAARYEAITSFGDVAGHPDTALALGPAGVTLVNMTTGAVISSAELGLRPEAVGPLAWSPSQGAFGRTDPALSVAIGGYGSWLSLFAVLPESPAV